MGALIGGLAGLVIGVWIDESLAASLSLAAVGALAGFLSQRSRERRAAPSDLAARVEALERRLAAIEAAQTSGAGASRIEPVDRASERSGTGIDGPPGATPAGAPIGVEAASAPAAAADLAPPPRPAYGPAPDRSPSPAGRWADPAAAPRQSIPSTGTRAWVWFTSGNTLTRVGVVILFFGVAFLLAWLAEHLTLSIEWKLALVAAGGFALVAAGLVLSRDRPAYGLSLQGAGAGVLYLTTFTAARYVGVLEPLPAFGLLAAIAAGTVAMAWRFDSQPLAALALAGGFLAPILVGRGGGDPVALFAWFAVLNVAIAALAWHRTWRALNALGAIATFGLAILWGARYYTPLHFPVVQPFLAFYFAIYVVVAILQAKRAPIDRVQPIDAITVFGVPVVAFALEAGLVRDHRYGAAVAALALALVYAALDLALRRREEAGLRWLGQAFGALAVVFATLAIPFTADPRWTPAWWGLEAAAVWWLGCRQGQPLARAFALGLQLVAGAWFALAVAPRFQAPAFATAEFLGAAMIGIAGIATARLADQWRDTLGTRERALVPLVLAWGLAWWMTAGVVDVLRARPGWLGPGPGNAALAWVVVSVIGALAIERALAWPRLAWAALALVPAMLAAAAVEWHDARTTLGWPGVPVWCAAWVAGVWALSRFEALYAGRAALASAHALAAVAGVAWAAWEAGEWTGRFAPPGTAWIAVATATPMVAFLAAAGSASLAGRWPWSEHSAVYSTRAGAVIAAALVAGFVGVNFISPGGSAPLPWLPIANPLDLGLAVTIAVLAKWARGVDAISVIARRNWIAGLAFLAGNGLIARTAHHWGDVPWRFPSLVASKPLQATITLAWTATALVLMIGASRRGARGGWLAGAALLGVVVVKLFVVDLAALSGLPRVAAFLGAGAMLLAIGYFAPPPSIGSGSSGQAAETQAGSATPDGERTT